MKNQPATYPQVDFSFTSVGGKKHKVQTLEEQEFPQFYHLHDAVDAKPSMDPLEELDTSKVNNFPEYNQTQRIMRRPSEEKPQEGHQDFSENRKGITYDDLFGPYIQAAKRIIVTDPYIRYYFQIKNMMEFVEMVVQRKAPEDQIAVHLVTGPSDVDLQKQRDLLDSIQHACIGSGVEFSWVYDESETAHARDITTDTGWKIVLDRGLDIYQAPSHRQGFNLGDRLQEHRMIKKFYVTYVDIS